MGSRLSPAMVTVLRDVSAGKWLSLHDWHVMPLVRRGLAERVRGIPYITDAGREALAEHDKERR